MEKKKDTEEQVIDRKLYELRRILFLTAFIFIILFFVLITLNRTNFAIAAFGLFLLLIISGIFISGFYYLYKLRKLSLFLILLLCISYIAIFIVSLIIKSNVFGAITIIYIGWSFVVLTLYVIYVEFKYIKPQLKNK